MKRRLKSDWSHTRIREDENTLQWKGKIVFCCRQKNDLDFRLNNAKVKKKRDTKLTFASRWEHKKVCLTKEMNLLQKKKSFSFLFFIHPLRSLIVQLVIAAVSKRRNENSRLFSRELKTTFFLKRKEKENLLLPFGALIRRDHHLQRRFALNSTVWTYTTFRAKTTLNVPLLTSHPILGSNRRFD